MVDAKAVLDARLGRQVGLARGVCLEVVAQLLHGGARGDARAIPILVPLIAVLVLCTLSAPLTTFLPKLLLGR